MKFCFVLGNGVSRLDVDLSTLKTLGPVYGCNALYREFVPDVLISTDQPIANAIQNSGYAKVNRLYTRKPLPGQGALPIQPPYYGFSSGPIAVAQACLDGAFTVYMIGFDMGPTVNNRFNNVYADTEFYKKSSSKPTYTGNWARQIVKIAKDFPHVTFFRIQGATTAEVQDFKSITNLAHLHMADFLNRINNTKDL